MEGREKNEGKTKEKITKQNKSEERRRVVSKELYSNDIWDEISKVRMNWGKRERTKFEDK